MDNVEPSYLRPNGSTQCVYSISYFHAEHIIYLYIMTPIALIGIFLNSISIIVYSDKSFSTVAFKYLKLLSITDLFICIIVTPYFICFYSKQNTDEPGFKLRMHYLRFIIIPFSNIASNLATLFNLLVNIERLISVRFPTRKAKLFTTNRYILSCVVVLLSLIHISQGIVR